MSSETSDRTILDVERLRLSPIADDDTELIFPLMRQAGTMAFWDMPESDDPELNTAIVEGQIKEMASGQTICRAVCGLIVDQSLGLCDLPEIDWRHHRADVGFVFCPPSGATIVALMPYRRRSPRPSPGDGAGCWHAPIRETSAPEVCW